MEQFRTTVSVVFWSSSPEASDGLVAAVNALLPAEDQSATLATVNYFAEGRPVEAPPLPDSEGVTP